jgi:hypothetical protein
MISDGAKDVYRFTGLTKREFLAALALQGLLNEWPLTSDHEALARDAVRFADALIAALDETPQ